MPEEHPDLRSSKGTAAENAPKERMLGIECVCSIVVDGARIEYDIAQVELQQFIDHHHKLSLKIRARAEDATRDIASYAAILGKPISLTIEPSGGVVEQSRSLTFVGVVTQVDQSSNIDSINITTIEAHSPTIAMDGARHNVFFHDQTRSDMIGAIVRNYPITVGTIESTSGTLKFHVQHRQTDYDFIMQLATASGLFAHYDGREFKAIKASSSGAVELVWRQTLGSFSMGLGTQPQEFAAQVYNYEQSKSYSQDSKSVQSRASLSSITKKAPDASSQIYKDPGVATSPKVVADTRSLDELLLQEKSKARGKMITCRGQSSVPEVTVGKCIQVKGMDKIDGHYLVVAVTHTVGATSGYNNSFICRPLDIAYPTYEGKATELTLLQSAVVVDNNDPDQLGRVKVKFPWLEGEETPWVRTLTPHAGPEYGWYVIPEINDEVLVGYEFGSPDYPIVLGALYNKNAPPASGAVSPENEIKQFRTRSGNQIQINDMDGSEEIAITTKDGDNKLVLSMSGPSITVESKGDISIKGANVSIEADQEITIKAGTNANIEAGANLKAKASGNFDAEGAMTNVKGNPINLN